MIATHKRKIKGIECSGGEDLPVGTIFHIKGARKNFMVIDCIDTNSIYNCEHCGFYHLCHEFQENSFNYIPVCDWDKREDHKNVVFKKI